ncbi:MAG: ABC transporter substrate-binding protein [Anaerolineales bacterium]|nr:ABC transporter substrate-binding protein [Anaerolineales bacterium]
MRAIILCFIFALVLVPLSSEAQDDSTFPITIVDATGHEVTLESIDAIASGSGDVTEIIVALGLQDKLVGIDISSTYPPGLDQSIEVIGFARRLTVEPIAAVQPTVFFCTEICTPTVVLDQLRELGIPVVIIPDNPEPGLDLPIKKIEMVAAALGVPEQGQALAEKLRTEIGWTATALSNITDEPPYVLMVYVRGTRLQLISGEGVPANDMIEAAGGIDAAADIGVNGYTTLNAELILTSYPDIILLMQGGVESAGGMETIYDIQGIAQTPAGQNDRFLVYDDMYLLGMSTRTGSMLLDLAHNFHPSMTWELQVQYPYTLTDATDVTITVDAEYPIATTNDELFDVVQQLGYHPLRFETRTPKSIVVATLDDEWMALREDGETVIVVNSADDIASVANALGVSGRGEALIARRK